MKVFQVETTGIGYTCALMFWTTSSIFWIYITYLYLAVKYYFFFSCLFYIFCQKFFGGIDTLALKLSARAF